jgi:hypothetical protein
MVKTILFIFVFAALIGLGAPLRAEEMVRPGPSILVDPAEVNTGTLVSPEPVHYTLSVTNLGNALLYISKIKYY